mmetsp:Transcript_54938/g.129564  ORF Transcript_54938/g.129564 Transcript_54938/m.129564 type:complete len:229 (-) Transcript_54938:1345-2031(-)
MCCSCLTRSMARCTAAVTGTSSSPACSSSCPASCCSEGASPSLACSSSSCAGAAAGSAGCSASFFSSAASSYSSVAALRSLMRSWPLSFVSASRITWSPTLTFTTAAASSSFASFAAAIAICALLVASLTLSLAASSFCSPSNAAAFSPFRVGASLAFVPIAFGGDPTPLPTIGWYMVGYTLSAGYSMSAMPAYPPCTSLRGSASSRGSMSPDVQCTPAKVFSARSAS